MNNEIINEEIDENVTEIDELEQIDEQLQVAIENAHATEHDDSEDAATTEQEQNEIKELNKDQNNIIEAALFAAGEPLSVDKLGQLFEEFERPSTQQIKSSIAQIMESMEGRGVELIEVGNGYRFQAKADYAAWLQRLWEKKPPRYSRALLETLALIIYQQPITRGEIEDVRGVAVSTHIMKTLQEREWVKIVGYRDAPGKPALFGSTKQFLDYFNLKSLDELPPLQDLVDFEELEQKLGQQLELGLETDTQQQEQQSEKNLDETVLQGDSEHSEEVQTEEHEETIAEETAVEAQ